jgi:hypothetical protein
MFLFWLVQREDEKGYPHLLSLIHWSITLFLFEAIIACFLSSPLHLFFHSKNHQELPSFIKYIGCCGYRW